MAEPQVDYRSRLERARRRSELRAKLDGGSISRGPNGSITTEPNIEARNQLVSNIRQNQPQAAQGLQAREERAQESLSPQRGSLPIVAQIARRYVEGVNPATLPDAALPIVTGAPSQVVGGLAGLAKFAYEAGVNRNPEALQEAVNLSQGITGAGTIGPFTESGEDVLGIVGETIEPFTKASEGAGNKVLDATGSPLAATLTQMGIEALPAVPGAAPGMARLASRRGDVRRVEAGAERAGVDLGADPLTRNQQIVESGNRISRGQTEAATSIAPVAESLTTRSAAEQAKVKELYITAREEGIDSSVREVVIRDVLGDVATRLESFPVDVMPNVGSRINALGVILNEAKDGAIPINRLETWRQSLGRSRVRGDDAQNEALRQITQSYDNAIGDVFVSDMVSGSPAAIDRWTEAIDASRDFFNRFDEDKIIAKLQEADITPKEVKNLIFGINSINARGSAVRTVGKIKEIFGEDSPEMASIRAEMGFDIVKPLLGESPDFNGFIRNYDNMIEGNGRLARSVFGEEVVDEIENLRNITASVRDNTSTGLSLDPIALSIRMMAGNRLARNAAKLKFLIGVAKSGSKRAFTGSERNQIISGLLGYDVSKSVFNFRTTGVPTSAVQTLSEEERE